MKVSLFVIASVLMVLTSANRQFLQQQPGPAPGPGPVPAPGPVGPGPVGPVGPGPIGPGIMPGMIPPMIPPIIPPFFPPLGFPFLGPLGFPLLGGIGLMRLALMSHIIGKRQVDETVVEPVTKCFITSKTIDCSDGFGQRIACAVEPRLGFDMKLNLTGLALSEKFSLARGEIFNLISPKSSFFQSMHGQGHVGFLNPEMLSSGKFTFINPKTLEPELLSFYFDVTVKEPGFVVKEKACYDGIVDIILPVIKDVRFNLIVS